MMCPKVEIGWKSAGLLYGTKQVRRLSMKANKTKLILATATVGRSDRPMRKITNMFTVFYITC